MPQHQPSGPEPRARPLADLPLASLIDRAPQLAKDWALALIQSNPLEHLDHLPLEQLAHDAPALCEQVLRALGSAAELARLTGQQHAGAHRGPVLARQVGMLAGARDAAQAVLAAESLRGVLWESLLAELGSSSTAGRSHSRTLTDISDRLAYVCSATLPEAIAAVLESQAPAEPAASTSTAQSARGLDSAHTPSPSIKIVDEHPRGEHPRDQPDVERTSSNERIVAAELTPSAQIQIRDERGEEGPAAWIGSIGRQLERFEQDRLSFAVLLLELSHQPCIDDQPGPNDRSVSETLERALQQVLRDGGGSFPLTRERAGRYWLLAPRTDRSGAADLAERLSVAAKAAGAAQGVEVLVAVGTAVCPQDGSQASALAAHADIGLYAARSRLRSAAAAAAAPLDERS